jgi:hypothetical protein
MRMRTETLCGYRLPRWHNQLSRGAGWVARSFACPGSTNNIVQCRHGDLVAAGRHHGRLARTVQRAKAPGTRIDQDLRGQTFRGGVECYQYLTAILGIKTGDGEQPGPGA